MFLGVLWDRVGGERRRSLLAGASFPLLPEVALAGGRGAMRNNKTGAAGMNVRPAPRTLPAKQSGTRNFGEASLNSTVLAGLEVQNKAQGEREG